MIKINNKSKLFKLTKKQILATILAFSMATSLGACKRAEKKADVTTTETTVETTVTPTTTPSTDPVVIVDYEAEANKLYEENKEFFINQYGNDKEYAIKEITNTILVITNNSETITNEDLRNTFYAMDNMFMPTNVIQTAGNYITDEPIEYIANVPNLATYIEDDQAQEIVNENTAIVNEFIDSMNNGTEKEKEDARILVLQKAATLEEELDEKNQLGELSNGDELAINMSNKGIINLAGSLVVNGVLNYTDRNGVNQTIFLIPDTYGAAVLNTFRFAEEAGAPYDTMEIDGVIVNGRYIEYLGPDGFEKKFVTQAEKNTIEDTLAITKYDEAVTALENEYSRISTEYYMLNNDCKTLTI